MSAGAIISRWVWRGRGRAKRRIVRMARAWTPLGIAGTVTRVQTRDPVAALSFDDGPHPEFTRRLLDILARHDARATFFMLGEAAQRCPEAVRSVAEAGHAIGNHSWDHSSFALLTRRQRRKQILDCEEEIVPFGQRIFRPPFGDQTLASRFDAWLLRYLVVTWDVGAMDYMGHEAGRIVDRTIDQIRPGSIVLFHDAIWDPQVEGADNREPTLQATDMILERLRGRFRFVTIPELLRAGRPVRQRWFQESRRV